MGRPIGRVVSFFTDWTKEGLSGALLEVLP